MPVHFTISRTGNDFFASADSGPRFFVGRRVPYEENIGLYNIFAKTPIERLNYAAADYAASHGFWAEFVEPTAICEGRNFLTLNTYDRAAFTFGFGQFAAHVPNGNFVLYFRAMLALPDAAVHFPGLSLVDGRISRDGPGGKPTALESDASTKPLMQYLNPDLSKVQDAEVLAAARLIHWTSGSPMARDIQVSGMVRAFQASLVEADRRVGIDGRGADICCAIADILHHGRGGGMRWSLISGALAASRPLDALIAIGAPKWEERKRRLRADILRRSSFPGRSWSRGHADFI